MGRVLPYSGTLTTNASPKHSGGARPPCGDYLRKTQFLMEAPLSLAKSPWLGLVTHWAVRWFFIGKN